MDTDNTISRNSYSSALPVTWSMKTFEMQNVTADLVLNHKQHKQLNVQWKKGTTNNKMQSSCFFLFIFTETHITVQIVHFIWKYLLKYQLSTLKSKSLFFSL